MKVFLKCSPLIEALLQDNIARSPHTLVFRLLQSRRQVVKFSGQVNMSSYCVFYYCYHV